MNIRRDDKNTEREYHQARVFNKKTNIKIEFKSNYSIFNYINSLGYFGMLEKIYKSSNNNDFRDTFLYIRKEENLIYNHVTRCVKGNFEFLNSPYLKGTDKIMNMEDEIFIMTQALYILLAFYYKHENNIDYDQFSQILGNIVVTDVSFKFNQLLLKNLDDNSFKIKLMKDSLDNKGRLWYKAKLSLSDNKHRCIINGCILDSDVHR